MCHLSAHSMQTEQGHNELCIRLLRLRFARKLSDKRMPWLGSCAIALDWVHTSINALTNMNNAAPMSSLHLFHSLSG